MLCAESATAKSIVISEFIRPAVFRQQPLLWELPRVRRIRQKEFALKVRKLYEISIDDSKMPDTRSCQAVGNHGAQGSTSTNDRPRNPRVGVVPPRRVGEI